MIPALVPTLTSLSDDCGLETEAKQWFPPPSRSVLTFVTAAGSRLSEVHC